MTRTPLRTCDRCGHYSCDGERGDCDRCATCRMFKDFADRGVV